MAKPRSNSFEIQLSVWFSIVKWEVGVRLILGILASNESDNVYVFKTLFTQLNISIKSFQLFLLKKLNIRLHNFYQ